MSASQGSTGYSIHSSTQNVTPISAYNTKSPLVAWNGERIDSGSSSSAAAAGGGSPVAAAAPIAQVQTPQQAQNAAYMPQLNAQMQKDPSNGYADQLKTLMNGQFSPNDPSYQWRYDQGQQAVERSAAARGLLQSGNAAIELQQYGQGMASQEYQAQFNRTLSAMGISENAFQSSYNRLAELSGMNTGIQTASMQNNYNYASLAERAQNNQAQIGLGYAGLAERQQANQGQLGVAQGQLLDQYNRTNQAQQAQQFNQQSRNNTDSAFMSAISGSGIGNNGYDSWGNSTQGLYAGGQPEDSSLPFTMSGYF